MLSGWIQLRDLILSGLRYLYKVLTIRKLDTELFQALQIIRGFICWSVVENIAGRLRP